MQAGGLLPSSSNTYGALGIGISTNGSNKGDGHEKKKKVRFGLSSSIELFADSDVGTRRSLEPKRASLSVAIAELSIHQNGARCVWLVIF